MFTSLPGMVNVCAALSPFDALNVMRPAGAEMLLGLNAKPLMVTDRVEDCWDAVVVVVGATVVVVAGRAVVVVVAGAAVVVGAGAAVVAGAPLERDVVVVGAAPPDERAVVVVTSGSSPAAVSSVVEVGDVVVGSP